MKFVKIFFGIVFGFGMFFCFSETTFAQISSCTHGSESGTCVLGSSDCANGSVYSGTECTGNNERTLCCVTGGGGGTNTACTAADDGSKGTCHASGGCPSSASFYHQSSSCSGNTPVCCTSSSGGGGGGNTCTSAGTGYTCLSSCGSGFEPFSTGDSACLSTGRVCCKPTSTTTGNPSGGTDDTSTGWTGGLQAVKTASGLPEQSVGEIVSGLLTWILTILGFIAIIAFVISGILYLTAAGNDAQIKTAKTAMTYSILGVIVALVGYVIILAVEFLLSGSA